LNSIPRIDEERDRLSAIEGVVPNQLDMPEGCAFQPRCPLATGKCVKAAPALEIMPESGNDVDHAVACWNAGPGSSSGKGNG